MPQPLRDAGPTRFDDPMAARPKIAVHIARITAQWAFVEIQCGVLLGDIVGSQAHVGVEMYLGIGSAFAQRALLEAAANAKLNKEKLKSFKQFMKNLKDRQRERNRIVHGLWAYSDKYPNDLLICLTKSYILNVVISHQLYLYGALLDDPIWDHQVKHVLKFDRWKEQDFIDVYNRIGLFLEETSRFLSSFPYSRQLTC